MDTAPIERPGLPVMDVVERSSARISLVLGENALTDREKAEIRYSMEVEWPYPEDAEMALFNSAEERGTEWIPVSQETFPARPRKSGRFTATRVWFRVGDELLHSRSCYITLVPGRPATLKFPPTSWAEYVKRNGLPEGWATDD